MAVTLAHRYSDAINPIHAILLAGSLTLFVAALLSDIAYARSFHIQWNNFASWLIAGGLLLSGIALIFAIADMVRAHRRVPGSGLYAILLLLTWIIGFLNALIHARDAWASMPTGLVLSAVTAVLACAATWFAYSTPRIGGAR